MKHQTIARSEVVAPDRLIARLVLVGLGMAAVIATATPARGQASTPPAVPPPAVPQTAPTAKANPLAAQFDAAARSPESIAKIDALLTEMLKAYHDAPTISDTVTLEFASPQGKQNDTYRLAFGKGTDAQISMTGAELTALGDTVTVTMSAAPKVALQAPLNTDINTTLKTKLPGFNMPVPHFVLRYKSAVIAQDLAMETLPDSRFAGLREADGMQHLLIEGTGGAVTVSADAATKLVKRMEASFTPPGTPPDFQVTITLGFAPVVADALAQPMTVDTTGRRIVASMEEMQEKPKVTGDMAPDWTMTAADGTTVTTSDLRGTVVVLDFWAMWCAPCKRGLPYIEEFSKWAAASGKKVKVFGVNTLEPQEAEARRTAASKWWTEQAFTMPLLFDIDDSVAGNFGIRGLPATFVIGSDGKIVSVHIAIDTKNPGQIVEALKADVAKALDEK
ncbi:MAG: TlpA disulfide reductase family protein [Phycisphaerae bacterium]|nr:TlpA disulfide reductase family protein [Phycisphaerae bacterium]